MKLYDGCVEEDERGEERRGEERREEKRGGERGKTEKAWIPFPSARTNRVAEEKESLAYTNIVNALHLAIAIHTDIPIALTITTTITVTITILPLLTPTSLPRSHHFVCGADYLV